MSDSKPLKVCKPCRCHCAHTNQQFGELLVLPTRGIELACAIALTCAMPTRWQVRFYLPA